MTCNKLFKINNLWQASIHTLPDSELSHMGCKGALSYGFQGSSLIWVARELCHMGSVYSTYYMGSVAQAGLIKMQRS